MLRFGKFLRKIEIEIVVARDSFQSEAVHDKFSRGFVERSAVIFVGSEFAKVNGLKEGQIVSVAAGERSVKLKVVVSKVVKTKAIIPNSIYASYLTNFNSFKRFTATIEVGDGRQTNPLEILNLLK
jgi:formylmethanofuran dehydrogenase subunit D